MSKVEKNSLISRALELSPFPSIRGLHAASIVALLALPWCWNSKPIPQLCWDFFRWYFTHWLAPSISMADRIKCDNFSWVVGLPNHPEKDQTYNSKVAFLYWLIALLDKYWVYTREKVDEYSPKAQEVNTIKDIWVILENIEMTLKD